MCFRKLQLVVFGALAFGVMLFLFGPSGLTSTSAPFLGRFEYVGSLGIVRFHIEVEVGVLVLVVEGRSPLQSRARGCWDGHKGTHHVVYRQSASNPDLQ